ncbi:MAG: site-specific integrase [Polaromonas sp.]|nr:site-specific integrase [Polaromonas sp.]
MHHFAYMRAIVNGIDRSVAADRFLDIDHGNQVPTAHRELVESLQRVARRMKKPTWRLLGVRVTAPPESATPTLHDWAESQGLNDDWSETEIQAMYAEAFPPDRKLARNARVIKAQLDLLRDLQTTAAEQPKADDDIGGWFDDLTAARLAKAGLRTLNDLRKALRAPAWWSAAPAIGESKAARISVYFDRLCSDTEFPEDEPAPPPMPARFEPLGPLPSPALLPTPNPAHGQQGALATALPSGQLVAAPDTRDLLIGATSDAGAIDAWINARSKNKNTRTAYRREAERFSLWLREIRGKGFQQVTVEDAAAFMDFLSCIPPDWIAKGNAKRYEPGWAPFQGQLRPECQRQTINVVSALFNFLAAARYVDGNPWSLVNKKVADDREKLVHDTRAFTPPVWSEILQFVQMQPPSPARSRMLFVLRFTEATGLRASELLEAKVGDLRRVDAGWTLAVLGKGGHAKRIAVPSQAIDALNQYLEERGLQDAYSAPAETRFIVDAVNASRPIAYQALYKSTKTWFQAAINNTDLTQGERQSLKAASLHWLRHTCGTRALERNVPLHVVQSQLRHKDPRTTMRYSRAQIEAVVGHMETAFSTDVPSK